MARAISPFLPLLRDGMERGRLDRRGFGGTGQDIKKGGGRPDRLFQWGQCARRQNQRCARLPGAFGGEGKKGSGDSHGGGGGYYGRGPGRRDPPKRAGRPGFPGPADAPRPLLPAPRRQGVGRGGEVAEPVRKGSIKQLTVGSKDWML